MPRHQHAHHARSSTRPRSVLVAGALCALLAACGGSSGNPQAGLDTQAPVALTPAQPASASGGNALTGPVNEVELRKAVERYGLTKQRSVGYYDFAGADLNGDGRPEAIVLFTGADWCVQTGCSLVVFQEETVGLQGDFARHPRASAAFDRTGEQFRLA